jgi:hypothetical protein
MGRTVKIAIEFTVGDISDEELAAIIEEAIAGHAMTEELDMEIETIAVED